MHAIPLMNEWNSFDLYTTPLEMVQSNHLPSLYVGYNNPACEMMQMMHNQSNISCLRAVWLRKCTELPMTSEHPL